VDGTGYAGVRGRGRSHRYSVSPKPAPSLWERACPRSRRRGGWHRLRRCSRPRPLPQVQREPESLRRTCGSGQAREAGDAVDGTGYAGVRGRGRSHRYSVNPKPAPSLWERVHPRSRRRGGWHRLRRCSRL